MTSGVQGGGRSLNAVEERHIKAEGNTPVLLRLRCHAKGRKTVLACTASTGTPTQSSKNTKYTKYDEKYVKREQSTTQEKSKESNTKITEKVKLNITFSG